MRFGTDGVRGVANADLTVEHAVTIGRCAATVLGGGRVLIGRDTRRSGPMLEAALAAGVASAGASAELVGVIPTPGLAAMSRAEHVPAAMISASHNPFADNGIKLFAAGGTKLSDRVQGELEAAFAAPAPTRPVGIDVGLVSRVPTRRVERYVDELVDSIEGRSLEGLAVVLDCANGAAAGFAGRVFERLGASVSVLFDSPDGRNINDGCGSTHPAALAERVVSSGAHVGFAFDGDADRLIAVDERGRVVDGDHLIAIAAIDLAARDRLTSRSVVVTVLSNLGFRLAMAERGIAVVETPVGDRSVLEALASGGLSLGGEQSGHLVFADLSTTGDGILAAVQIADVMVRTRTALGELASVAMTRFPQVMENVVVVSRPDDLSARIDALSLSAQAELGESGRVLIRPSGTEPLIRVMVEAPDERVAADLARRLGEAVGGLVGPPA